MRFDLLEELVVVDLRFVVLQVVDEAEAVFDEALDLLLRAQVLSLED